MSYFIIINIFSFVICLIDKIDAIYDRYRVPEKALLMLSFCGGCFGVALSMLIFHHKTRKIKFKLVYLSCLVWIGIFIYVLVQ